MPNLRKQFDQALKNIEINGQKRDRAIDAHTEIRELLQQDEQLKEWGVEPLLIGSYGRETGIYPGKDVDVFLRFTKLDTRSAPRTVFDAVWKVIVREYGQFGQGAGRAQQQARSVKVLFPDHGRASGGDFSVDAVPAVRNGGLWAIPTKDQNRWVEGEGRWVTTGAVLFGELSTELNQSTSSPKVGNRPAYKPIVKLVRQTRETHLGDKRPGGLYLEFVTFEAWRSRLVAGGEWDVLLARTLQCIADRGTLGEAWRSRLVAGGEWDVLLARTLQCIADRFGRAGTNPLMDPVLGTPIAPPLSKGQVEQAATTFGKLAAAANRALAMNDTDAATEWRKILGGNDRFTSVFPYPPNSRGRVGSTIAAAGAGAASGTGATTRRNEARRFG